ncbi:YgjV family protein [Shewanella sp. D64]|uniref:YgjV family protein n=1 Tax=unclassified Shewanella TaxID=196818 RepID=UPI0022BA676D|nr:MULTISPECIES: YgjV family protein [unclassified Shewanella]MEC4727663.1 YgjV family protein [Shewanella sp. D64]MEC4739764.1 YgjV family protein [Shewanella sp. E94]WBJ94061.1 YgjV family protein [Shewanella sp. MTB7]
MSVFVWSQVLIAIAIVFDIASFQFKQRRQIIGCLCVSGVLISVHFILLEQWTAAGLLMLASIRYFCSIFTTSKRLMSVFLLSALTITIGTFSGLLSVLSFSATVFQTTAAFCLSDQRLRQLMIVGTSLWLVHNYLAGSPSAVLMEVLFIGSNLVGYYRYYGCSLQVKEVAIE